MCSSKLTLFIAIAALLAGCSGGSRGIDIAQRPLARSPAPAPAPHARAHLTRLGCVYLREQLGLPALGGPPPAPPGLSSAQPTPPPSRRREALEAYLATHTNCAHAAVSDIGGRAQHPPTYRPPHLTTDSPPVSAYYPPAAQRLGEEGTAVVRVCIGPRGRVRSTSIIRSSGSPLLDRAALRYARATSGHWWPAMRDGRPAPTCARLPVRFSPLGRF